MIQPERIGKYEVLEIVGRGGFATVYKARDPFLKRIVAIKFCPLRDETLRRRFLREAEIAGSLDHPAIVRTFDCAFTEEGAYLVQEFLEGEDLRVKIKSRAAIPHPVRVGYLVDLARGLAYAHSKGVLHRDIKPGNVRVLPTGRIKILDFGIGKITGAHTVLTQEGQLLGTAGYLAPEQARGMEVDERADLFAFGALSYELLTFRQPFPGQMLSERLQRILDSTPDPISKEWPSCPAALERLVFRCLEKEPDRRHASFSALLDDLMPIHRGFPAIKEESTAALPFPELFQTGAARSEEREASPTLGDPAGETWGGSESTGPIALDVVGEVEAAAVVPESPVLSSSIRSNDRAPDEAPRPLDIAAPVPTAPLPVASIVTPMRHSTGRRRATLWLSAGAVLVAIASWIVWVQLGGEDTKTNSVVPTVSAPIVNEPPAAAPEVESGILVIDAVPWGEVVSLTDGEGRAVAVPAGAATPLKLTLPGGRYRAEILRPGSAGEAVPCEVSIEPSALAVCRVELARVEPDDYFGAAGWWP